MKAPCQYFGSCGGCSLQDKEYADQLAEKAQKLKFIFNKDVSLTPSPHPFHYRSRADFLVRDGNIGFRPKANPTSIVDIENCLLLSEKANALLAKVRLAFISSSFSSYNLKTHEGFLRYVSVRESSHGVMLIFTTSGHKEAGFEEFISSFEDMATSIIWLINDSKSDDITGSVHLFIGQDHIVETLNNIKYKISPLTFFQANRVVSELMFAKISDHINKNDAVLDLYCGVGSISLQAARKAKSVLGVESNEKSVAAAIENAALNSLTNVSFEVDDASEFLVRSVLDRSVFDTIIVDPPRAGLGLSLCHSLLAFKAKKIIYMSCNPASLRNDMAVLSSAYSLEHLESFDMFAQTDHVESLAILTLSD